MGHFRRGGAQNAEHRAGFHYVTAALAADGSWAAAYLPTARPVTLEMARLRGPVAVRRYVPISGRSVAGAHPSDGAHRRLTPPASKDGGDSDWVLLLERRR